MTLKNKTILDILDNPQVNIDILQTLIGDYLCEGAFRKVFSGKKGEVMKIDVGETLANSVEFDTWQDVMKTPIAKWFAPVINCSVGGKLLIMKRADMDRPLSEYPKELPSFFEDIKKANFGFIGKQIVCVDYGYNQLRKTGLKNWRMKKVTW